MLDLGPFGNLNRDLRRPRFCPLQQSMTIVLLFHLEITCELYLKKKKNDELLLKIWDATKNASKFCQKSNNIQFHWINFVILLLNIYICENSLDSVYRIFSIHLKFPPTFNSKLNFPTNVTYHKMKIPLSIQRASALNMRKIIPNSITSFDNQQPINKTKHFPENFNNKNQVPRNLVVLMQ